MTATLKDIGKIFGVSPMTVSNAINRRKGVASEKADGIRRYADQMGYSPSYNAKSLVTGQTNTVGLCLRASVEDPWFGGLIPKIQRRLRNQGLHLNVMSTDCSVDEENWALKFFSGFRVEAAIIGPLGYVDDYAAIARSLERLPHVVAFDSIEALPIDHVRVDAYGGSQMAVDYLVSNGHKHIGYIASHMANPEHPTQNTRYAGFYDAMHRHNLDINPKWIIQQEIYGQFPYLAMAQLFDSHTSIPTAWFCHNDRIGARLIRFLLKRGIRIPDDVSVLGFDNQPICELITPALTTVGYDRGSYADKIVDILFEQLENDGKQDRDNRFPQRIRRREISPKLIERESVSPRKSTANKV